MALRGEAAAVADPQELPELAAQLVGALESPHAVTPAPPHSLTPRELTILRLITHGQPTKAIARELAVSVATVERHITHLYAKIGVRSRAEATAIAIRSRA